MNELRWYLVTWIQPDYSQPQLTVSTEWEVEAFTAQDACFQTHIKIKALLQNQFRENGWYQITDVKPLVKKDER